MAVAAQFWSPDRLLIFFRQRLLAVVMETSDSFF